MNIKILQLTLLCILLTGYKSFSTPTSNFDIIIIAGQSNAVGSGYGPYFVDTSLDHQIYQLSRSNNQVIPGRDTLQNWYYDPAWINIGFAMSFAREYAKNYLNSDRQVLLIPAAKGSTSIADWQPGGILYQDMVSKSQVALAYPGSRIVALLWHQGEGDVTKVNLGQSTAAIFKSDLIRTMTSFRNQFSNQGVFPIIMGELVPSWYPTLPATISIRSAIYAAAKELSKSLVTSSAGLKSNLEEIGMSDDIHFSAKSQVAFGRRYFLQYKLIRDQVTPREFQFKNFVGYQAWFGTPGDLASNSWSHWSSGPTLNTSNMTVEMWPDVQEYLSSSLLATPFLLGNGNQAKLFSSAKPEVIDLHFKWMQQYKIDGAFLQWFIADNFNRRLTIANNVKVSAEKYKRLFSVEFDISGATSNSSCYLNRIKTAVNFDISICLKNFWMTVVDSSLTTSPYYMKVNGRPLLSVWGIGFTHNSQATAISVAKFIQWIKADAPAKYRATILGGIPSGWRTLSGDSLTETAWSEVYASLDILSPWNVGRFNSESSAISYINSVIKSDVNTVRGRLNQYYLPVIFPGFSWSNLVKVRAVQGITLGGGTPNLIPRKAGNFMWSQAEALSKLGLNSYFTAMFDEVDEGTAIFKTATDDSLAPRELFTLKLNADGINLPSDWYLQVSRSISENLKNGEFTSKLSLGDNRVFRTSRLTLLPGQTITNTGVILAFQHDGNLVVYDKNWRPLWASNTIRSCASNCRAIFNYNGELVLYQGNSIYWKSPLAGGPFGEFTVSSQSPYLKIVNSIKSEVWNSSTFGIPVSIGPFKDEYVSTMYYNIFEAAPSASVLLNWNNITYKDCAGLNRSMVASASNIFSRYTSNYDFVMKAYLSVLLRTGDPGGVNAYTDYLNRGIITRSQLLEIFVTSSEFNTRCATTGYR